MNDQATKRIGVIGHGAGHTRMAKALIREMKENIQMERDNQNLEFDGGLGVFDSPYRIKNNQMPSATITTTGNIPGKPKQDQCAKNRKLRKKRRKHQKK